VVSGELWAAKCAPKHAFFDRIEKFNALGSGELRAILITVQPNGNGCDGGADKLRQKLAIDLDRWGLFSVRCIGFRLCFASD